MTTEDLVERIKRYPLQIACGAVVLVCALLYYFRMGVVSEVETNLDEALRKSNRVEDNIAAGASLQDHLSAMNTFVSELGPRLVQPADLADNLKYFYKLESETGVTLGDLRQSAPGAKGKDELFVGVGYDVMLSGTFIQVVSFINELEHGERFFRLRNFNLQRGREVGQPSLMLSMNIELLGSP
ncbi:MAG: hypothetical protein ACREIA_24370 [Opitutaceae bacterium]